MQNKLTLAKLYPKGLDPAPSNGAKERASYLVGIGNSGAGMGEYFALVDLLRPKINLIPPIPALRIFTCGAPGWGLKSD